MTDLFIASLDFVGFLGFAIAFVYSYKNYQKTKHISLTWLLFTIAMVFLSLFSFLNFLEWSGVYPEIIDEIQNSLFPIAIVSMSTFILVTYEGFLKPMSK